MNRDELMKIAKTLDLGNDYRSKLAESLEFFRIYAGEKSTFYKQLSQRNQLGVPSSASNTVSSVLKAYIRFLEKGLNQSISLERQVQIDVVSDFLEQSQKLLSNNDVHPAAPTVLIGASLEEFLRNWIEENDLSLEAVNAIN